jgi:hypothetical protein
MVGGAKMDWARSGVAFAFLLCAALPAVASEFIVTMSELTRNPLAFAGQRVVLSDCFMIGANALSGAQCSVNPIDAATLVYVDSDTWTAQARRLIDECNTAIIEQMCVIKVTGDVTTNRRGQAVILNAIVEIVSRPSQAI